MRVMLFGANGYMGAHLRRGFPDAITPDTDIANADQVADAIRRYCPSVVINAAGKSGYPNVDWCEQHRAATVRSNVLGPLVLLEACARNDVHLVHLSTGCLYQGDNGGAGFEESDPPNFSGSFYVRSKRWAEEALSEFPVLILRPRMPFDGTDHPKNLISKLKKYSHVLDAQNSMTSMSEFIRATQHLIALRATGTYNTVCPDTISPSEVMQMYKERVDPKHQFEPIDTKELRSLTVADRSTCKLRVEKLESTGIKLTPVRAAVTEAMDEFAARS